MVKMVPDKTARFAERPHYEPKELDRECERIVSGFLRGRRAGPLYPITTDELTILIEQDGADLDQYADLSQFGADVEGATIFHPSGVSEVWISDQLANDDRRENRLRTTLAHEFGHLRFHRYLWVDKLASRSFFDRSSRENKAICKRDTIIGATSIDWMEWQAGYISGAILMPAGATRRLVADLCAPLGEHAAVTVASETGRQVIETVMEQFQVSKEAARVRLLKLGLLATSDRQPSLFS
ncbi:ImmA/IrrE family metallo-endopeptidase [Roseospira visakhapatnamensis]|uniref:IrrE N-terminal-like domain-containing protein n=1 Tax=Roseospira visakhapatnamensis TaxID=390880 RepID=A0A7W6RFI7_9PROT|nr:ImmA/IrrE family metallo-endopeptidase [Roseospira visakhapatnamensis]MBB4267626.1 hypothetical protein [Roseospira visakhapatnamensis]